MRETRITQLMAAGLIIVALSLTGVKWLIAGITPGRTIPPLWHVDIRIGFTSSSGRSTVRLYLPRGGDGHTIIDEHFEDDEVPRIMSSRSTLRNRSTRWRVTRADQPHVLNYSIWLDNLLGKTVERVPSASTMEKLRQPTKLIQSDDPAIVSLSAELMANKRRNERFASVVDYVHDNIQNTHDNSAVSALTCLKVKEGSSRSMARLLCALLRARGIPCQLVGGVLLEEEVRTHAFYWVEAWDGQHWLTLCAATRHVSRRTGEYLAFFRGDYSLAKKEQIGRAHV